MIDLTSHPIYRDSQWEEDSRRKVRDSCVRNGRAARAIGLPIESCPPFRNEDMTIDWRNGWRWEDEERRREDEDRRQKK